MVIFSRGRGTSDRPGREPGRPGTGSERPGRAARRAATDETIERHAGRLHGSSDVDGEGGPPGTARRLEFGPYDVSEAPDDHHDRIDLGALRIPVAPDVDIQLETGPQGQIQRVQLAHRDSWLQLGAFAAPRTEGIWDEVRENLRSTLVASGAKPVEVQGEYGVELQARVRDARGTVEVRHIGIDGPRWFVHGVYLGAAAADPDQAGTLRDVLHGIVVDRGSEARPVSEALPLRLPPDAAAQLAEMVAAGTASAEAQPGTASAEAQTGTASAEAQTGTASAEAQPGTASERATISADEMAETSADAQRRTPSAGEQHDLAGRQRESGASSEAPRRSASGKGRRTGASRGRRGSQAT